MLPGGNIRIGMTVLLRLRNSRPGRTWSARQRAEFFLFCTLPKSFHVCGTPMPVSECSVVPAEKLVQCGACSQLLDTTALHGGLSICLSKARNSQVVADEHGNKRAPLMWVAAMPVAAVTATQLVNSAPYVSRRLVMMRLSRNDLPVPAFPATHVDPVGPLLLMNIGCGCSGAILRVMTSKKPLAT